MSASSAVQAINLQPINTLEGMSHVGAYNTSRGERNSGGGEGGYGRIAGSHPFEKDFTAVRGYMPFTDPLLDTDELTIHKGDGQSEDYKDQSHSLRHQAEALFTAIIGDPIPFRTPNIIRDTHNANESAKTDFDIMRVINGEGNLYESDWCAAAMCSLTVLGACYVMNNHVLVEQDSYGFLENNGRFEILPPGRHVLMSPLASFTTVKKKSVDHMRVGPISIIRINLGEYGLAEDNATPVILLPGMHVRNDIRFSLIKTIKQDEAFIAHGPVKFITVKSGTVQVCYIRGQVHVYPEGRFAINDPTLVVAAKIDLWGRDVVQEGPVTLVRVKLGEFGFADQDAHAKVLLPGLHLVKDTKFRFSSFASQSRDYIEYGPIKFFTVKTGTCRAVYSKGVLEILPEGRYAVNDITFLVKEEIRLMQQNIIFEKHPVLLLGGVKMLVEGLLTFQIVDPRTLIQKMGINEVISSMENIAKAELSRIFSTMHIEDISSEKVKDENIGERNQKPDIEEIGLPDAAKSILQDQPKQVRDEGEPRSVICWHVIDQIGPIVSSWGIKIIAFQLEKIKMADEAYSREYEQASLATAKAKANLRAQKAENAILLQTARANAEALKIEAEGKKQAALIEAEMQAEVRMMEAKSRNDAANLMSTKFGQDYAIIQQQVAFADALKATSLTVMSDSMVGRAMDAKVMGALMQR